jgi:CRP/FNR family transcriptional regulator, cyclic AMP receptor protein
MTGAEQDQADPLAGFTPFGRLSPAQRARVAALARPVSFPEGTRLFDEGQDAKGCWLIQTGQVALQSDVTGRGPVTVHTLGPGDMLGWSWLVPPHHWHFTATAHTPVSAIAVDTVALRTLADGDPALGYPLLLGILEAALSRLQSTRWRLLDLYGSPHAR